MRFRFPIAAAGTVLCLGLVTAADSPGNGLVVHEWGTFLAMNGSDGLSLDGMFHEEHALPAFVHARSKDQLTLRSAIVKGETPVIYFYAQHRMQAQVRVGFPGGLWTQWYPQAGLLGPTLATIGAPLGARNGHVNWNVTIVPPALENPELPSTSTDALWNHARNVDAAYVSAVDHTRPGLPREWERFIFYRGLGEAPLPIDVSGRDGRISAHGSVELRHLFILRVEGGRGAYSYVPALEGGASIANVVPQMDGAVPLDRFAEQVANDLAGRLVESGLYEKEARAMVNTWRSSYFATDGVRVLFVLPQSWTDRYIPLRITPQPAETVRVMVGRVEMLTPEREQKAERAIRDLASPDQARREQAFTILTNEGRYVEPIVRRTLRTTSDERVRALCRRLLLTDFVTGLRASITDAARGNVLPQNAVYARAQLASILREIGLTRQAKAEGETALSALELMTQPDMSRHDSRHTFRALARAHEGAGHDALALKWYGDFVEFGSRSPGCGGCHQAEGPRDMSFFRDWWAGRKFAEYAQKTGESARLIERHEAALSGGSGKLGAQLALAYLYEARGEAARAAALWSKIDPTPQP
jgi:hypothetical protein